MRKTDTLEGCEEEGLVMSVVAGQSYGSGERSAELMKIEDALLDSVRVVAEGVGVYRRVAEIVIERPVINVGSRLGGQLNDTRTGAPEFRGIGVGDELEFPYRIRVRQDCDLVERA